MSAHSIDDPMPDAAPVEGKDIVDEYDPNGPQRENKIRMV